MATLSAQYAKALFELALEQGLTDAFLAQAVLMRTCFKDAECRRALSHPLIPSAEKRALFAKAFAGNLHDDMLGLLSMVIDKGREAELVPALGKLIDLIEGHQKKLRANVLTASPMDKKQISDLEALLSDKFSRQVTVSTKVDPSLIAGPYIRIGGYLIDMTVKKRLHDMIGSMKER
jgi:F-type H+-transporting ATPase subunit delta